MVSIWEIWIDDLDGELAMVKTEGAARKVEVTELEDYDDLKRKLKIAEEALEFYEHKHNWTSFVYPHIKDQWPITRDRGNKARAALSAIRGEGGE